MLHNFTYHWLHIPSGRKGMRVVQYFTRSEFLTALNDYNRLGRETWKYWTE